MERDRRDELIGALKSFDDQHDDYMRGIGRFIGRLQIRFMNNPIGRFILARITTRIFAFLIVKLRLLGIKKGNNAFEIAYNWQKLARFFRIPVEVESATDDKVIILHPECTMGFTKVTHIKLCRASMNMDRAIVRRLGGKLTIIETITDGAAKCKHMVEMR